MFRFLTSNEKIERSFFFVPRFAAIIAGFWPDATRSCVTVLRFWLNVLLVAVGGFGETCYGVVHINNLTKALEAFCPSITKLISLLKMLTIFVYHRQFGSIVHRLRQMVMQSTANKLSFLLLSSGSLTNISFNTLPVMAMLYRYFNGSEVQNLLPFNIIIPQVFVEYPIYPLTYVGLTLSGAMTVFTFSAVDGFFVCGCMYMSGVFSMLQHDIRQLFAELKTCETASEAQNQKFQIQLKSLVQRHNAIIDLCSHFSQEFAIIVLWHFVSAALVLCCSILDLMLKSSSLGVLIYFFYSVAAMTQLFLYCIGSSYVSESSLVVADVLYDIEWYKCNTKTRKMILMMITRAQRPTTIVVPFFTPSLEVFKSIISTTGSYIALLKTFL